MSTVLDVIAWIFNGVCALIPDSVEAWVAGGGNVVIIFALLAAVVAWQLIKPMEGARRG